MIVECTLLDRWRYERIATLPADESFHFLSTAAFQAENSESCKRHILRRDETFSQFRIYRGLYGPKCHFVRALSECLRGRFFAGLVGTC